MLLPAHLTPDQFEEHVRHWLSACGSGVNDFSVVRLEMVEGAGGEYEIDVVVRMVVLGGAEIVVLVECKHHRHPIKREVLNALESKMRDTKAQKAMIFSTAHFQSGALEFARAHRIATVFVSDAGFEFQTRGYEPKPQVATGCATPWLSEASDRGASYSRLDRSAWRALLASN